MSGSSSTLLCHRPLRTVRASFPAYGSSLNKFNRRVEPVAHVNPEIVLHTRSSTPRHDHLS
ncbi:hypothetical protein BWP16_14475 [Salmonella enterica subsp. enterica serovar Worthington]|nr:hypothetical protein BST89_07190 [Salmonella enterica subsp. enterica serovar Typhi]OOD57909.1 hypothetical protein BWP16_14475 [Salmonella enterica subsp. enterica serovar Worthington]